MSRGGRGGGGGGVVVGAGGEPDALAGALVGVAAGDAVHEARENNLPQQRLLHRRRRPAAPRRAQRLGQLREVHLDEARQLRPQLAHLPHQLRLQPCRRRRRRRRRRNAMLTALWRRWLSRL